VEKNAKFLSNQTEADQFTAENVILSAEVAVGDIKLTRANIVPQFNNPFFFLPLIIISRSPTSYMIMLA
jgi:hypothetical protein